MKRLLIVEDDETLGRGISLALRDESLETVLCRDLAAARQALGEKGFDAVLLDINLPDGNGLDFLRQLRAHSTVPVIMLTAKDLEVDVVAGLELGADDYITKPFSLAILRARVNAQLRRGAAAGAESITLGEYQFDFQRLVFMKAGRKIELSKSEQRLLRLLVLNRGQTLTRAQLIDRIWADEAEYVYENALSVTVKRLRDKLGDSRYIKTVYGIGYTWAVD